MLEEIIGKYLEGYRVRYQSASFAEYPLGHVSRLLGRSMAVDINEATVLRHQEDRLCEKAAPKSINEEVRFLFKIVGNPAGDLIRCSLKKEEAAEAADAETNRQGLGLQRGQISPEEKAKKSRSPYV